MLTASWGCGQSACGDRRRGVGIVPVNACDNTDEPDGSVRFWLTALRLSADARAATLAGRWERALTDTPTTLAWLGGRLYVVNSQFFARRAGTAAPPFTVSALPPPG